MSKELQIYNITYENSKEKVNEISLDEQLNSIAFTNKNLSEQEKNIFYELLKQYKPLFNNKTGCAKGYEHKLILKNKNPKINQSYTLSSALIEPIGKVIKEMLEAEIIETSISQYCSPLRVVMKADGLPRICLDARQINENIEDDVEGPPIIAELMQRFHDCKFLSKIDLRNSYWQVKLHIDSRPLNAFRFNSKMYQWVRVPFGIKTAGSALIRAFTIALQTPLPYDFKFLTTFEKNDEREDLALEKPFEIEKNSITYVDDTAIATKTFKRHIQILQIIFSKLMQNNFTIKIDKSQFFESEILFLGFILSSRGIEANPERIKDIVNFETPSNRRQLQSLLGACNYYRRFALRHNDYITPFRDLLSKDANWTWTQEHAKSFEALKENFVRAVCLSHVIPGAPYKVQCDVSLIGIGGILYQIDNEDNHRIISIASRCLTSEESRYTTTEIELLAIIYCVSKFRYYLIGVEFETITDHKGLTFLTNTVYHNSRLIRWSLLLQQYRFKVTYCKGSDNVVADFLSRNPNGRFHSEVEEQLMFGLLNKFTLPQLHKITRQVVEISPLAIMMIHKQNGTLKQILKNLNKLQSEDTYCRTIIDNLKLGRKSARNNNFELYQDILFHRENKNDLYRIVVPNAIVDNVINYVHAQLGHPGVFKTLTYIKRFYYFKFMHRHIKKFVLTCDLCQRVEHLSVAME